ncbi:alpha/beta fold hydrolase [Chengkuizengella axinellae]|uniref:Alpha/beta fold hydrolase n=1 Tax=Chengkuizengella axinellae TaxID=3064388 RepID=A0ABT9IY52_9BACL|nr:alpha/beta fold hydrolase [Chengkuizengella sp. 2205SS18-9]MDP5274052.1 alpha/beta fold hydrolase [Chengkuizengella sp. 2205SS18-9]
MLDRIYMLHGFMGTGDLHFKKQVEFFKDHMEIVNLDLPGHGLSEIEASSHYFENTLEWLIEQLKLTGAGYIIGLSLGASLAIHAALKEPNLVKGIILTGYTPFIPEDLKDIMEYQYKYFMNIEENDRKTAIYLEGVHGEKYKDTLKKVLYVMTYEYPTVAEESISSFKLPTLVLNGSNDLHEINAALFMKSKNPEIKIGLIPGAGHTANIEKPHIFNHIVKDFINDLKENKSNEDS